MPCRCYWLSVHEIHCTSKQANSLDLVQSSENMTVNCWWKSMNAESFANTCVRYLWAVEKYGVVQYNTTVANTCIHYLRVVENLMWWNTTQLVIYVTKNLELFKVWAHHYAWGNLEIRFHTFFCLHWSESLQLTTESYSDMMLPVVVENTE